MIFSGFNDQAWGEIKQIENELVWMLCLYIEFPERLAGKVLQIACDDDTGSAADRRRQDMAVIFIWQEKARNEVFICCYERIWSGLIHELPRAFQLLASEVGPVLQEIPDPFFMYICGPLGTKHSRQCEIHEEASQLSGIEYIRVEEDNECRHNQIPISWS